MLSRVTFGSISKQHWWSVESYLRHPWLSVPPVAASVFRSGFEPTAVGAQSATDDPVAVQGRYSRRFSVSKGRAVSRLSTTAAENTSEFAQYPLT